MRFHFLVLSWVIGLSLNSFASSPSYKSDHFKLACGFSKDVQDYIGDEAKAQGEENQLEVFIPWSRPSSGDSGEVLRQAVVFSDKSYLILMNFLVQQGESAPSYVSCIVEKGPAGEAHKALEKEFLALPREQIQSKPKSEFETRIEQFLSEPAKRLSI